MKRRADAIAVSLHAKLVPGFVYRSVRGGVYECVRYIGPGEARLRSVSSGVTFTAHALVISGGDLIAWDSITDIDYTGGEIT